MATNNNDEERIMARGLKPPGPLLLVRKRLRAIDAIRVRVIVSNREAADDLVNFFETRGAAVELDRAGEDYHVVADLRKFKDED
ncbi:MAG: sulfurtransferase TusA family protein [Candidatus Krumholzibacteria bacterium]|nr:sulfurtransferase TusA family protein [Candidatus Krumholzibacteria bacterium]